MNERQPNSKEHKDSSGWQRRKTRLMWLMWPSTQPIGMYIKASSELRFAWILRVMLVWLYSKLRQFISSFSLRIFVSAIVITTSITALSMFRNLCLVILWLHAGSLVPKSHFQLMEVWEMGWQYKLAWQLKLSSVFCTVLEHVLSTNESTLK